MPNPMSFPGSGQSRSHTLSLCWQHWALLSVSLLNCLLSTACSVGLALAIGLTIHSRGMRLVTGCSSPALPADARAAIATNDCPFNTTRIYVSMRAPGALRFCFPYFFSFPSLHPGLRWSAWAPLSSVRVGAAVCAPQEPPPHNLLLCRTRPWRSGSPPCCWRPRKLCCLEGALWQPWSCRASALVHADTARTRYVLTSHTAVPVWLPLLRARPGAPCPTPATPCAPCRALQSSTSFLLGGQAGYGEGEAAAGGDG